MCICAKFFCDCKTGNFWNSKIITFSFLFNDLQSTAIKISDISNVGNLLYSALKSYYDNLQQRDS
jgi:hypothetical protein